MAVDISSEHYQAAELRVADPVVESPIPKLYEPVLLGFAPQAFRLRGFERVETRDGGYSVVQDSGTSKMFKRCHDPNFASNLLPRRLQDNCLYALGRGPVRAKKLAILSSFLFAQQGAGLAADFGTTLYVGGHVGRGTVYLDNAATARDLAAAGFGSTEVSADNKDTVWKVVVGMQLGKYFAVELAAAPGGDVEQRTTLTSLGGAPIPPTALEIRYSTKDTFMASALVLLPLDKLSLYGRLGLYTTQLEAKGSSPTIGLSINESVTSNGSLFGLGIVYEITRSISARAEWERLHKVGENGVIRESDVDVVSIGLLYLFR